MDFELSADQVELRDAARRLLDDRATSVLVRKVVDRGGGMDADLWRAMVEQGWPGVETAEEHGGLGSGFVEAAVLLEEVGRHVAPAPFMSALLATNALAMAGADEWVERLLSGGAVACVAWRADAPVLYAPSADVAIVGRGDDLIAVDLTGVGTRPPPLPAMDLTRELGRLGLPDDALTITIGGRDAVELLLDRGATAHALEMLGAAARVLEMSVEYAGDRVQFGRPIGSFQAVKHRCADMLVDVEGMRSAAYYAAWCVAVNHPDRSVAASMAKVWCSDASRRVMASGLQVHGGIGFTWEHDLHLYLKRAQLDQVSFGDATFHRERLAGLLRDRIESGGSVL